MPSLLSSACLPLKMTERFSPECRRKERLDAAVRLTLNRFPVLIAYVVPYEALVMPLATFANRPQVCGHVTRLVPIFEHKVSW